jgi:hypothetical protein
MWTAIVAPIGSLLGVVLGLFFEPVRSRIAYRAQHRRDAVDRCARLIEVATTVSSCALTLNFAYRIDRSGQQISDTITEYNSARLQVQSTVGLLRIYGPDTLLTFAVEVRAAVDGLHQHLQAPEDGQSRGNRMVAPKPMQNAIDAVNAALEAFAYETRDLTK